MSKLPYGNFGSQPITRQKATLAAKELKKKKTQKKPFNLYFLGGYDLPYFQV